MSTGSTELADPTRAASVFAALGDSTRLAVVGRLSTDGPLSIARLTAGSNVTRQAITKHLAILAGAGVVRGVRRGRERIWELAPDQLSEARAFLDEISHQWNQALDRLRTFVEE
ncbi:MAG TPA: metalloregulator ArsR/SmtB family transcription factor [Chloroflexota bacterium]|nr:metalloregulator ArsR/SmtB family transcription factor [Chloroflexota bacterium]